jgi:hypothetical protein
MNALKYPLEQLLKIKNKRFEQALKLMEEKRDILVKEEKQLKKLEEQRDKVKTHKKDKLKQLTESLDEGTTSDKIEQMEKYLEVVNENLLEKQNKVTKQEETVVEAKKELEEAKKIMFDRQKDIEKMQMHKKQWLEEVKFWETQQEALLQDELGSVRHMSQKKQREK